MRILLAFLLLAPAVALADEGVALYGAPKYAPGFDHFDYVNPDAPKGGTVKLSAFGSFDNFNPFILKGEAAAPAGAAYETLMIQSADEPFSEYGLLAKDIAIAPDRTSVTFTMNEAAKFSDGTQVTASDVVWSFNTLRMKGSRNTGTIMGM